MKILSVNQLKGINGKNGYKALIQEKGDRLGISEILCGKTPKGTYFYKEKYIDKLGKFVYTVLQHKNGKYLEATDTGNKIVLKRGDRGYVIDDKYAERVTNGRVKAAIIWTNDSDGKRFLLPQSVKNILEDVRIAQEGKDNIFQKFLNFLKN